MKLLTLLILCSSIIFSQKRNFELEDAMNFHLIRYEKISDDGKWLIYRTAPDRGDSKLYIQNTESNLKFEFQNANYPQMSENAETVVFSVSQNSVAKANDKDGKIPDTLNIFSPISNKLDKIIGAQSVEVSNDGNWLTYTMKEDEAEYKSLYLRNIKSKSDLIISNITESKFDSTSSKLFYMKRSEDNALNGVYYRNLDEAFAPEYEIESDTNAVFNEFEWNLRKNILAYKKAILDSNDKAYNYSIQLWIESEDNIELAVNDKHFPNWYIPKVNDLYWTEDGERLWFGIKPESQKILDEDDAADKISEEDYYDFDKILEDTELYLWHHDDDRIITEKQTKWNSIKDEYYESVYHLESKRITQLADTNLPSVSRRDEVQYALGYDNTPYLKRITWDYWYYDLYLVDQFSGEKTLIAEELITGGHISPTGAYVVYFKDNHWWVYDVSTKTRNNVTEKMSTAFYDELNDRPRPNTPYGFGGWFENSGKFYLYDRYDIWEVNAASNGMLNILQATGAIQKTRFRIANLDKRQVYFADNKPLYLEAFNEITKAQGLLSLPTINTNFRILENNYSSFIAKAKNADKIIFTQERYDQFPDIHIANSKFEERKQLTNLHPEIEEYNWGTTELIAYENSVGDTLQGYYIVPDDFNENTKYPLFVYFYERFSDRRHEFVKPMINHRPIYPWYVGQGYCMFFPDIKFRIGRPGDSGMDAVMSGIRELAKKGFIDTTKVALHGHSWSGYQSAYFVTQTDFFAACVTGAPVSNMTSAYSGIRLGSGLARQFQYEKTQSRIGGTMIDSLDAYIENSPVFYADKMNTPMLIMFGDIDDAVPWQQGVELYLACRRFGKPAILLQYEKEPHHLKKYPNKLDYAIKMKEFFDHYVLGKEAAPWILEGAEYRGTYNTGN